MYRSITFVLLGLFLSGCAGGALLGADVATIPQAGGGVKTIPMPPAEIGAPLGMPLPSTGETRQKTAIDLPLPDKSIPIPPLEESDRLDERDWQRDMESRAPDGVPFVPETEMEMNKVERTAMRRKANNSPDRCDYWRCSYGVDKVCDFTDTGDGIIVQAIEVHDGAWHDIGVEQWTPEQWEANKTEFDCKLAD